VPISNDRAYVYLQLPGSLEIVTAGFFEQQGRAGVAVGVFVYNPAYFERADAVPLDPFELPLREGRFETVKLSGIFGSLRDASPDAWGARGGVDAHACARMQPSRVRLSCGQRWGG
jgi:serine/threonine-protein kinase HipA